LLFVTDMRQLTRLDSLIAQIDHGLRTIASEAVANRQSPAVNIEQPTLSDAERKHAAGLMRVNHVGEVCAQALYQGQAWVSKNERNRAILLTAAQDEVDHLAWTEQRLAELDSRTSLLNPLWYAGAFALGVAAGKISEAVSLGFVVETEVQVGAHLDSHLQDAGLPVQDSSSRAIVTTMRDEELAHAEHARLAGAMELPNMVKLAMRTMAKVMTTTAYKI
jgi:ubiquinone biosynthesis monooxygenase Coq7